MTNPLIVVESATYGLPDTAAIDVTEAVKRIFDKQYVDNPQRVSFELNYIGPWLFGCIDPAVGVIKSLTIAYSIPGAAPGISFSRGSEDLQTLVLIVSPVNAHVVSRASYGTPSLGLDLTEKVARYLGDPGNPSKLVIGSESFNRLFCAGHDPAPDARKYFSVSFTAARRKHPIHLCGHDGETIDFSDYFELTHPNQTWMTDLAAEKPNFSELKLREICLPATHDSGSYALGSTLTSDPQPQYQTALNTLKDVTDRIDVIPYVSKFIDPAAWAYDDIVDAIRGLSTTTRSDVRRQLSDGIRCLDLRIYYNLDDPANPFYTYHGLVGVPLSAILSEVAYFISHAAPDGEIVYVTLGHFLDDREPKAGFTDDQLKELSALLLKSFPDKSRIFGQNDAKDSAGNDVPLLDSKYSSIVSVGGGCSKVILVVNAPDKKFWSPTDYSPPDAGNKVTSYCNTDDVATMLADQLEKGKGAGSKAFALYLTLTPQDGPFARAVITSLRNAVLVIAAWTEFVPIFGLAASAGFLAVAAYLAGLIANRTGPYTTLEGLASKIFDDTLLDLATLYKTKFSDQGCPSPSFIYMDYYENYFQQKTDHEPRVAQLVELAKSISKAKVRATFRTTVRSTVQL